MRPLDEDAHNGRKPFARGMKGDRNVTSQVSSRARLWTILLTALGAIAVSLMVLLQWESPARANDSGGRALVETVLAPGPTNPDFPSVEADDGDFQAQIVGGKAVSNGKYPFMAHMTAYRSDGTSSTCGGTLIDNNSVLTAAHCVPAPTTTAVDLVVGRTVLSKPQGQIRWATKGFLHPRYDGNRNSSYDVAVLKLNKAVSGIKPIKLATAKQDNLEKPGTKLTVAGWGNTRFGGTSTDRMREVSLPVVSDAKAQKAWSSYPNNPARWRYFPALMVAAGKDGTGSSCQGDSGGPLFAPGSRTQVGIVSYGHNCNTTRYPAVFTEVNNSNIRSFIVNAANK